MSKKLWSLICQIDGDLQLYADDEPTVCPINPAHEIGEVRYLSDYKLPCEFNIPILTENRNTVNDDWTVKNRALLDFDLFGDGPTIVCNLAGRQVGGGTGYIRIYDWTNAVELGSVEITDVGVDFYEIALSNLPSSGKCAIELQMKTNGTGEIWAYVATLGVS